MDFPKTAQQPDIGPSLKEKFPVVAAQNVIRDTLQKNLSSASYILETSTETAKNLADEIRNKLKTLLSSRYKLVVQVLFSEQRGQGLAMGFRGFWDNETDSVAQATFSNETLVAIGIAYALYSY